MKDFTVSDSSQSPHPVTSAVTGNVRPVPTDSEPVTEPPFCREAARGRVSLTSLWPTAATTAYVEDHRDTDLLYGPASGFGPRLISLQSPRNGSACTPTDHLVGASRRRAPATVDPRVER